MPFKTTPNHWEYYHCRLMASNRYFLTKLYFDYGQQLGERGTKEEERVNERKKRKGGREKGREKGREGEKAKGRLRN